MKSDKFFKSDLFRKVLKQAEEVLQDPVKFDALLVKVKEKWSEVKSTSELDELLQRVTLFTRMSKNILNGRYKHFPIKSLVLVIAGLLYFLMPIDLFPDFIPVAGLLDDLTILAWIYNSISKDIDEYREWEDTTIDIQYEE